MKPTKKYRWLAVVSLAGLILTGCGQEQSYDSSYKSTNTYGGSNDPVTVTNTASSPAEMNVGDVFMVVSDEESSAAIDMSGVDRDAKFILAVTSLDTDGAAHSVTLSSENSAGKAFANVAATEDENNWQTLSAADALDQQIRSDEAVLSANKELERADASNAAVGAMKAMMVNASASVPSVGTRESFKVLGSLSSLGSYKTVTAEVKCVAGNVIFYVDTETNSSDLNNADVSKLCSEFNDVAAREMEMFGTTSDVNGDGHFAVLMTPQVNRLGAMGGGIITGFFYPNDLYMNTNSNQREMIYVLVPDPTGRYGMTLPKNFAMDNLLTAVLPHELQHAISYNQKVFVNNGASEESWLNEGLSHLAEDLLGYGQENPSRVEVFLNDPSSYSVVASGSPNLAERGASYLFLRYLYEQASDKSGFVWNLLHSTKTGIANIEEAFAGKDASLDQFSEFMLRWSTAMVMTSFNLSKDSRFSYADRVFNNETGNWEGVCLSCDTEDGRGTILAGVQLTNFYNVSRANVAGSATEYYYLNSFPTQLDLSSSSGQYSAALVRVQ